MSLLSSRPLTQNQEVSNITVDDDLTCNAGTFTALSANTSNVINMTATSLTINNSTNYNNILTASMTGNLGYFSNFIVPNITGTAITGNMHVDAPNNRPHVFNGTGWKSVVLT